MEYYVAKDGEKVGPLTQYKLVGLLRDGDLSPDHKAWHKGMDTWLPISEIPSLTSALAVLEKPEDEDVDGEPPAPEQEKEKTTIPVAQEVRPLTRFWARQFDFTIVTMVVLMFSDIEIPQIDPDLTIAEIISQTTEMMKDERLLQLGQMQVYAIMMWMVIEGIMLSVFKTTPGKALFGIKILAADGSRISAISGISRAFLVYILGLGLFYPSVITLIAMTFSFFRLLRTGNCLWDQALGLRVQHPPLSVGRVLLAIIAFIALMTLQNLKISI